MLDNDGVYTKRGLGIQVDPAIVDRSFKEIFEPGYTDAQRSLYITNRLYQSFTENTFLGPIQRALGKDSEHNMYRIIKDDVHDPLFASGSNIYLNSNQKLLNQYKTLNDRGVNLDNYENSNEGASGSGSDSGTLEQSAFDGLQNHLTENSGVLADNGIFIQSGLGIQVDPAIVD